MHTITVLLPKNRLNPGTLVVTDDQGAQIFSCACLGRADNAGAAKVGNATRDPLRRNGDTPLGEYIGTLDSSPKAPARSYGIYPPIRLTAVAGQALLAAQRKKNGEAGRDGLLIHGGALSTNGKLRPTYGCIRVSNEDHGRLAVLLKGLGPLRILVIEKA